MRTLVTGGAGFIGSHLVELLVHEGHSVQVLDNFSAARRGNLAGVWSEIEMVEGDIRDLERVRHAVKGMEVVFHQGARGSVAFSVENPVVSNYINVNGTVNVLVASRDAGVRRVVFASSSSVYGDDPELPKCENSKVNPISPYAITKLVGELYCRTFYQLYGLETFSLRYFNVFGPRQNLATQYTAVIPKFIHNLCLGQRPIIHGDGEQSRDFTYVENVINANLLAATAHQGFGETFNIACGEATTVNELCRQLAQLIGAKVEPTYVAPRPGDVRHTVADISKAKRVLRYYPVVDWREGLKRTVSWYLNSGNTQYESKD